MNTDASQMTAVASEARPQPQSKSDFPTEPGRRSSIKRFIALMAVAGVAAPSLSQAEDVSADVATSRERIDKLEPNTPVNEKLKKAMSTGSKHHTNSHGNTHSNNLGPVGHTNGHSNEHTNGHTQPK
jgi:hypothetical protein